MKAETFSCDECAATGPARPGGTAPDRWLTLYGYPPLRQPFHWCSGECFLRWARKQLAVTTHLVDAVRALAPDLR